MTPISKGGKTTVIPNSRVFGKSIVLGKLLYLSKTLATKYKWQTNTHKRRKLI
ncbi:hypothetical protein [Aquimarina agarivorans]|uniref:hypothetical protein n=1 Tax=Aquimarina agarivorans TaxID=980584 RepID=UPI001300C310|nr:hypothetical protein [Aquimarina agarivorans]